MFKKNKETVLSIIEYHQKNHTGITLMEALDIFTECVESYKNATKRKKLDWVAESFIAACLIAWCEPITGAQAFEIFNNLATDLETNKVAIEKAVNKIMAKKRKQK